MCVAELLFHAGVTRSVGTLHELLCRVIRSVDALVTSHAEAA